MTAFFVGCSYTYGDDLDHPYSQSWPALVCKATHESMTNAAVSGGTNDRIVYQTIKNIDKFDKFYVAWTSISRFTRYRADNNHEVNFNPGLINDLYGKQPEFQNYARLHYEFWHNELFAFKTWLQQIVLLQRYLEAQNKKYIMISTFDNCAKKWTVPWQIFNNSVKSLLCFDRMNDQQLLAEHEEIQNLQRQIDHDRFLGWTEICIIDLVKDCPTGGTGHPLTQGHQLIADYILAHDTN